MRECVGAGQPFHAPASGADDLPGLCGRGAACWSRCAGLASAVARAVGGTRRQRWVEQRGLRGSAGRSRYPRRLFLAAADLRAALANTSRQRAAAGEALDHLARAVLKHAPRIERAVEIPFEFEHRLLVAVNIGRNAGTRATTWGWWWALPIHTLSPVCEGLRPTCGSCPGRNSRETVPQSPGLASIADEVIAAARLPEQRHAGDRHGADRDAAGRTQRR